MPRGVECEHVLCITSGLDRMYIFQPVAVESLGLFDDECCSILADLGLWRRPGQHLSLSAHLSCNPATQLHSASVTRPDRIFEFDIFVVSNFPPSRTATDGPKIITITTIILVITLIRRFVNRKIDSDQNALKCIVCDIVL